MAITALAFAGKSLLGNLKGGGKKEEPSQKVTPKSPKVSGVSPTQEVQSSPEKSKESSSAQTTTVVRSKKVSVSVPRLKKTGVGAIDSALVNVSQSLGAVRGTLISQIEFNETKTEELNDAKRKDKRKKKEKESEKKGPVANLIKGITKPLKTFGGSIFKFLLNIVLGNIALFVIENIETITKTIEDVVNVVKDFFGKMNKWVVQPLFNMVKAIAGPINTAIKALAPEKLPDFDKEKEDIQGVLDKFDIEIPIISDIIKGFDNFLSTGDPRIDKEEFKEQVEARDKDTKDETPPPTSASEAPPTSASGAGYGTAEQRKMLDSISFAEGTPSYGTIYGGAIVPELERGELTVGQVLEMQRTGKLNGRDVGYARDGYDSDATGRYQFMSYVLEEEIQLQGIKKSEKFTPEMQDRIILNRIQRMRGVTPEMLAKEGMSDNVIDRLAPEFASFPNLMGDVRYGYGTSYYGQGGKSADQIRRAYDQSSARPAPVQTPPPTQVSSGQLTNLVSQQGLQKLYGAPTGPVRTSERGMRGGRHHAGIDFGTGGQKGWFCAFKKKGTVSFVGSLPGYGKTVIINCGDLDFLFAHLAQYNVSEGDAYNGQVIGEIGNTGVGSGEHLHFEVRTKGGASGSDVDPNPYVKLLEIGRMDDPIPTRRQETPQIRQSQRRGTGIDRNTSYGSSRNTTVVMPIASPSNQMPVSGASGMMSYAGGGGGRIDNNKSSINNKLYRQ